jgi:hypothetical protein
MSFSASLPSIFSQRSSISSSPRSRNKSSSALTNTQLQTLGRLPIAIRARLAPHVRWVNSGLTQPVRPTYVRGHRVVDPATHTVLARHARRVALVRGRAIRPEAELPVDDDGQGEERVEKQPRGHGGPVLIARDGGDLGYGVGAHTDCALSSHLLYLCTLAMGPCG